MTKFKQKLTIRPVEEAIKFEHCRRCGLEASLMYPLVVKRFQDLDRWVHVEPEVCICALKARLAELEKK